MAPPEQTQVGDDESGDAADVASTQTTQGTLPDVGRLVAMIDQYAKNQARIQVRLERLRRRFEDEIESPRKRRRLIADTPPGENVAHAQASALLSSSLTTGVVAKKKIIRKKQPENAAQKALRLANGRLSHSVRSLKKKNRHIEG